MELRELEATQEWRHDSWIKAYPLNRMTVLDYFKCSAFYDPSCNNEILVHQQRDRSHLRNMKGVEYEVDLSEEVATPNDAAFLIRKQRRLSPDKTVLLSLYYVVAVDLPVDIRLGRYEPILKGTVFTMPDLQAVMMFHTNASMYYLRTAMDVCIYLSGVIVLNILAPLRCD